MSAAPVVVLVVRPYATEEELLAAEAWSIDAKSMLLIGADPLPADTAVLFSVALTSGQKPIKAEGRVVGVVPAQGNRPAALKVRFKRFGSATKAFIERAVQAKSGRAEPERVSAPNIQIAVELPSAPKAEVPSAPTASAEPPPPVVQASVSLPEPSSQVQASSTPREPSGVRQRAHGPVAAPANREELLARLRERRRSA